MLGKESADLKQPHKFLDPQECVDDTINEEAVMAGTATENLDVMIKYATKVFLSVWKLKNALIFLPYNCRYDF